MKTKKLFLWLLLPFLALVISSCSKDSSSGSGSTPAANTPTVSIDEVTFDDGESEQIVTITLGNYKFFGAIVDAAGNGWCFVEILGEKDYGKIKITAHPNTNNTPRSCRVNVWVANTDDPDDDDKVELPIEVEQEAYKIVVTELTYEMANFETQPRRDCTWTYDGGGHFTSVDAMSWLWHRDWKEMHVEQHDDVLILSALDSTLNKHNGSWVKDEIVHLDILISGFCEPFDNCKVDTVTYSRNYWGYNIYPDEFWQTDTVWQYFKLANIPLDNYSINVNNKTGRLYFRYPDLDSFSVIDFMDNSYGTSKNNCYQEEIRTYIGGDRDEGEVELNFKIR